jgi:DNA-binding NtrC family response regulator
MVRLYRLIDRIAEQEVNVLISGETGTGKELVARAIHRRSLRAEGPFLAVPCASLLREIFEAELFGAAAGAYTGADEDRPGLLETLSGGTLLLDGVDQLGQDAQAKLLQVIDSGTFRRLGDVEPRRADVRFLASSGRDLRSAAGAGTFRPDLFYRLGGVEIHIPPLRQRRVDIAPLALHFIDRHAGRLSVEAPGLTAEARELLERQPWPGNARQLEGILLRAMLCRSGKGPLGVRELEPLLAGEEDPLFRDDLVERFDLPELKTALERHYLTRVFIRCRGDARRMMEQLGIKRTRLYTWLLRLGIDVRELRRRL